MKTRKRRKRRGGVLGEGTDGYVTDQIQCPQYPGYVAKVFKHGIRPNMEIQAVLSEIDPDELRYIRYHPCDSENIVFMKRLNPLDTSKMTKKQYRFLRESIELLHRSGISHGDLPGNVMVADDHLPRLIDWEKVELNNEDAIQIDQDAFFKSGQFKVK
jgi:hypothetical protein